MWSSPRPWGCFQITEPAASIAFVFPTPVGVFLFMVALPPRPSCLPHARGGVSQFTLQAGTYKMSSPRPWGCFYGLCFSVIACFVFPTPVGVFPPIR